jgi:hypothetical protein
VEHRGKGLSAAAQLELRQAETAPMLDGLKKKILAWKQQLLPKHPMAEAVNYALGQWAELTVFCSDGAVSIDNNVSNAASGIAHVMPRAGLCRITAI